MTPSLAQGCHARMRKYSLILDVVHLGMVTQRRLKPSPKVMSCRVWGRLASEVSTAVSRALPTPAESFLKMSYFGNIFGYSVVHAKYNGSVALEEEGGGQAKP